MTDKYPAGAPAPQHTPEGYSVQVVSCTDEAMARRVAPMLVDALADLGLGPAINCGRILHSEQLDTDRWEVVIEVLPE